MWTPEQLSRFLEATEAQRLYPFWVLAVTTGMRRGELCGLRWEDVDFEQLSLTVKRARVMVHGAPTDTSPKTAAGLRRLGLDNTTVVLLREQQRRQSAEQLACAPGLWQGDAHVFTDEVGRPVNPEFVTKQFTRAVRRAGLPPIRLHDIRHWHATAMLRAKVDVKVIADRLGHSSTRITQDIYQHPVKELDRAAAEKVAGQIFGPDRP